MHVCFLSPVHVTLSPGHICFVQLPSQLNLCWYSPPTTSALPSLHGKLHLQTNSVLPHCLLASYICICARPICIYTLPICICTFVIYSVYVHVNPRYVYTVCVCILCLPYPGGKGAYGAIDAIGGAQSQKIVASLRKNGKYILYGALDTAPVQAANMDILAQTKVQSKIANLLANTMLLEL